MASDTRAPACGVCRDTKCCSYCNGDGYLVEHGRLNPCGVCETSGICPVCRPQDRPKE